jgi:polysaccharide export outer membrane protein
VARFIRGLLTPSLLGALLLSAVVLTTAGCAQAPYVWVNDVQSEPASAGFVIVPGDVLSVSVYNDTQLSGSTRVRSDGYITLTLLGEVMAAGKTPGALAQELQAALSKFLQAPNVAVRVESEEMIKVTLIGELSDNSNIALPRNSNLLNAIAAGGGLSEYADKDSIFVIRQKPPVRVRFSYDDLVDNDPQAVGFRLLDGDVIYVE